MKPITLLSAAGLSLALSLPAQAALFTSDTSIGANDTNYDGDDIVVIGCKVTIDGDHTFSDLVVIENGIVTHSPITNLSGGGLYLNISNNVVIEAGSAIKADGLGFGPGLGAGAGRSASNEIQFGFYYASGGGGGFGGCGGSSFGGAAGGGSYGSLVSPNIAGSGGGAGFGSGGAGGGLVNLAIGGALVVDGQISANGAAGLNLASGGGSGGSLSITAPSISGAGSIAANGGMGESSDGGGGGGGRIALFFTTNDFAGTISAPGGQGSVAGGAGTVDLQSESGFGDQILVDNGGLSGTNTPLNLPNNCSLTISGGAIGLFPGSEATFSSLFVGSNSWLVTGPEWLVGFTVQSNAVIQAGGGISMDGVVTSQVGNPGGIYRSNNYMFGGGGGGGGNGGAGFGALGGAAVQGSVLQPTSLGSMGGAGSGNSPYSAGGAGGGAFEMNVKGTLTLNGSVTADGGPGIGDGSGGGAGGSVYLTVGALTGAGVISANGGGAGSAQGGGGGGGRIAVYPTANLFSGSLAAFGGFGLVQGGAGTIYLSVTSNKTPVLLVDNGGVSGASTPFVSGSINSLFDLIVTNGATLLAVSSSIGSLHNLVIGPNSFLIQSNLGSATLTIYANATIAAGGGIVAIAYSTTTAPEECGGSYGGNGGVGPIGLTSAAYGSLQQPTSGGQHGGPGSSGAAGGAGGTALAVNVSGTLLLNGSLTANGIPAPLGSGAGGGSGGGIYVTAGGFAGIGSISANGGAGDISTGGGGAGGRIAIYATYNSFAGKLSACGASGYVGGGAGTIYITTNNGSTGQVIVDNGGTIGTNTPISASLPNCDLTVANSGVAVFSQSASVRNLLVSSNSFIVPPNQTGDSGVTLQLTVSSNATILPTGGIILDGRGSPGGYTGYGGGNTVTSNSITTGGGGTFLGYGGTSAFGARGGSSYFSGLWNQQIPEGTAGGGGYGGGVSPQNSGGAGGGNLGLSVTGTLALGGMLSANGTTGPGEGSGGGAGGGIWVSAGTLTGSGTISANGGAGQLPYGGGGGGGLVRVTVTGASNQFTGTISAHGGAGATAGGAGGIYEQFYRGAVVQIILDNGGLSGTNTSFAGVSAVNIYDLTITNGAIAMMSSYLTSIRNLVIGSNSFMVSTGSQSVVTINLTGNVTVMPTGGIVLDGQGSSFNSGQGAGRTAGADGGFSGGGGGYGGNGGAAASGAIGGSTYGSATSPESSGSGGGSVTSPSQVGGLGGGGFQLTTQGTLALGGKISANGTAGATPGCGGGSGGSVWLTVGAMTGSGSITANGGSGQLPAGGGGGGGRIAVIASSNLFTGLISAQGGAGFANGGAGTVYTAPNTQGPNSQLVMDNGGLRGTLTALPNVSGVDLRIQGGAGVSYSSSLSIRSLFLGVNSLLVQTNPAPMSLVVTSNATVQAGAGIILDGSGNGAGAAGSGGSTLSGLGYVTGAGGGHGGYGGNGQSGAEGGNVYDVYTNPTLLGSGGGVGAGLNASSARGGGALELTVTGILQMDGLMSANGAVPATEAGGGGSGGSINLIVGTMAGAGSISATGASGDLPNGGGGGGGRIALLYSTNLFTGAFMARGGPGFVAGGAGTISLGARRGASALIVDNGGLSGTNTPISASVPYDLTISGAAIAVPQNPAYGLIIDSLLVESNAVLSQPGASGHVYLTVLSNAVVQSGAAISVDGLGYNASQPGPGTGMVASNGIGSGGGHGGMGGAGASGIPGGGTYDSLQQPALWGSAGGVAATQDPNLSQGGGAIELSVGGTFTINGRVSANGNAAIFPGAGGGAGGSVFLTVGALTGNGQISANGGAGHGNLGGGGGGGRIAISFQTNQFAGTTTVSGGAGFASGQSGTLWLATNFTSPIVVGAPPVLLSAVAGQQGGNLSLQWSGSCGATCQLQSSTDLIHWQSCSDVIISSNGANTLVLPVGGDPAMFFRLVPAQ